MSKPSIDSKVAAFKEGVNTAYKSSILEHGGKFGALKINRFSSGILPLDLVLGGGWPFSRVAILAGEYSSGKTLIAIKACSMIQKHCMNCRACCDLCKCGDFTPTPVLYIDQEGSFDINWARANGFDENFHMVARPESAEQAIDIVDKAIRENAFGMIVVDSIEALTPNKEIEESAEDWQMGLGARLVNKAMRRWVASLNATSQANPAGGPLILCINQIRYKIGVVMGDPRTLPKGRGQEFAASIIIYTKPPKLEDDPDEKETAFVSLRGSTKKNKTFVPGMEYEFGLALKDTDTNKKGEVDNADQLLKIGKKLGLVKKVGSGIGFDVVSVSSEAAFVSQLKNKPDLFKKLWREIIKTDCGVIV